MQRILTLLILILQVLLILLPTLSGEAPFPQSFSAQSLGSWIGGIIRYWQMAIEAATGAIFQGGDTR